MENGSGLTQCGRARVPKGSLGEAIGESTDKLQQGILAVLEMPVPWNEQQEQQQRWSEAARA